MAAQFTAMAMLTRLVEINRPGASKSVFVNRMPTGCGTDLFRLSDRNPCGRQIGRSVCLVVGRDGITNNAPQIISNRVATLRVPQTPSP